MSCQLTLHKISLLGKRPKNEDAEFYCINLLNDDTAKDPKYCPINLFIICDGHGGERVAHFVIEKLSYKLLKKKLVYPLRSSFIHKMYHDIQEELISHPMKIAQHCGCTCLVVIIYVENGKRKLQVINLGDCRAVMSVDGLAVPLTKDHKPNWPDEIERLEEVNENSAMKRMPYRDPAGDWRIGDLSVSRSFGDLDNTPHITHLPDVYFYPLKKGTEFIVMACDGLWDVLENHDVINSIRRDYPEILTSNKNSYKKINLAYRIGQTAIDIGSTDNITVMIIFP